MYSLLAAIALTVAPFTAHAAPCCTRTGGSWQGYMSTAAAFVVGQTATATSGYVGSDAQSGEFIFLVGGTTSATATTGFYSKGINASAFNFVAWDATSCETGVLPMPPVKMCFGPTGTIFDTSVGYSFLNGARIEGWTDPMGETIFVDERNCEPVFMLGLIDSTSTSKAGLSGMLFINSTAEAPPSSVFTYPSNCKKFV